MEMGYGGVILLFVVTMTAFVLTRSAVITYLEGVFDE
jgi:hypothetical protein